MNNEPYEETNEQQQLSELAFEAPDVEYVQEIETATTDRENQRTKRQITLDRSGLEIPWPEEGTDEWYEFDVSTKKGELLRKSRQLDVHRWSDHPEVNGFVDRIYETHFADGNQQIRKKHLKVVLLDLYVAWNEDPELKVAYSRDSNAYQRNSIYNELHISKLTIPVIDRLHDAGLVNSAVGFQNRTLKIRMRSRVWPTKALIAEFQQAKFTVFDVSYREDRFPIVLRRDDEKGIEFNPAEHDLAYETALLNAYNELLKRTFVAIPDIGDVVVELSREENKRPKYLVASQHNKYVRRIFNRERFDLGGRYFGGWWQTCPKGLRQRIFLDDCPTVELDYSSLHPTILYAQEGIDYWSEIGSDPYAIGELSYETNGERLRGLYKALLLILINATNRETVPAALRDDAKPGDWKKRLTNEQIYEAVDKIADHHSSIAHYLHSDAGLRLQNIDSQISTHILESFLEISSPVLLIHDSFIVKEADARILELSMQIAYQAVIGQDFTVEAKFVGVPQEDILKELEDRSNARYGAPPQTNEERELEAELLRQAYPRRSERYVRQYELFNKWVDTLASLDDIDFNQSLLYAVEDLKNKWAYS